MNKLKVSISARLYDHQGNPVRQYKSKSAGSFLSQFIELLHVQMAQALTLITDTSGIEASIDKNFYNLRLNTPVSNLSWGLLIGSGTDDVTIDDYALQSQITTDLTASLHTFVLSYPTANTRRLSISRTFTNTSVSPMSIEEVALYTVSVNSDYICLDRTLYSISIPATSSLTLTYRIDVSL